MERRARARLVVRTRANAVIYSKSPATAPTPPVALRAPRATRAAGWVEREVRDAAPGARPTAGAARVAVGSPDVEGPAEAGSAWEPAVASRVEAAEEPERPVAAVEAPEPAAW